MWVLETWPLSGFFPYRKRPISFKTPDDLPFQLFQYFVIDYAVQSVQSQFPPD
jgi:hypothetical protein